MPEGTPPVAPSNGVHPDAPQKPSQPAPTDNYAERESQLKAREEAISKAEQKYRNQLAKDAADKKGLGAKLSRLSELEKREQLARLNPQEYLKGIYGEKWHETLNNVAIHGVPPSDLIAAELAKFRDDIDKRFAERDAQLADANTKAQQQQIETARAQIAAECSDYLKGSAKEYPVFEALGNEAEVAQTLSRRVEAEFHKSGKVLSPKEVADLVESEMLGIVDKAASAEKYRSRLQEKMKPATVAPSSGVSGVPAGNGVQRRTLSNALTASTPTGKKPLRSEAERLEAAMRAFNDKRSKQG